MMSHERQTELVCLAKQGGIEGDDALVDLINGIMPMIVDLAWNFANAYSGSVNIFDDFVQEQTFALPRAMEGYDPDHKSGASFSTFARTPLKNILINLTRTPRPLDTALPLNEAVLSADEDDRGRSWVEERNVGPERPPEIELEAVNLMSDLKDALSNLSVRERLVVELHDGMGDYKRHTFQEISQVIDRTPERARQIKKEALSRLREDFKDWF